MNIIKSFLRSARHIYKYLIFAGEEVSKKSQIPYTQHLLCLVTHCSRGGEIGTESHRANYDCTLRVSVTVLASLAVQSFDNGLLMGCFLRQSLVVQFTTALRECL